MTLQVPPVLYKYRSVSPASWIYTEALLAKQELFMATRPMFNDPFECRPVLSHECTKEELAAVADRVLRKTNLNSKQRRERVADIVRTRKEQLPLDFAKITRELNDAMDRQVGIFCLSAKPDHLLMWSHYADSHSGICVGLDSESADSPFRNARPVTYSAEYPVCRVLAEDRNLVQQKATYTKADVWAYEEEWRLINFRDGACVKRFEPRFLREVVLGARTLPEVTEKVVNLTREHYPHATVLQARLRKGSYGLDLVNSRNDG